MSQESNLHVVRGLETLSAPIVAVQRCHTVEASYSYTVRMPDGAVVVDSGERPCESYVQGFTKVLLGKVMALFGGTANRIAMTNGGVALSAQWLGIRACALVNQASIGPVIGIGSVPVTITDSSLITQVSNGTGVNQLQHAAVSFAAPTVSGTATIFTCSRVFTNASAGPIIVKEIGLAGYRAQSPQFVTSSGSFGPVLLMRDLIGTGTGVSIGSGAQLTLNVNFRTNI